MQTLILNEPGIKDFAKARNNLLGKSISDWNFFLDTDEKLSKPLTQLFSLPAQAGKSIDEAYYIYRKNYFLGKYVGTDKIIRLVKNGTGKWVRIVHEFWQPKNIKKIGKIQNNYIIHNTAGTLGEYINKINNYSTLHAKANFDEGKKATLFKIIFYPIFKFIITLIKSRNIVFSIMQSLHSFLSWTKLYLQQY